MHTASPFKYNVTNPQFDLVDPAVKGAFPTFWIPNPKLLESAFLTIGCDGCDEETWTILAQKRAHQAAQGLGFRHGRSWPRSVRIKPRRV